MYSVSKLTCIEAVAEARLVPFLLRLINEGNLQYATCIIFPCIVMLQYFCPFFTSAPPHFVLIDHHSHVMNP